MINITGFSLWNGNSFTERCFYELLLIEIQSNVLTYASVDDKLTTVIVGQLWLLFWKSDVRATGLCCNWESKRDLPQVNRVLLSLLKPYLFLASCRPSSIVIHLICFPNPERSHVQFNLNKKSGFL